MGGNSRKPTFGEVPIQTQDLRTDRLMVWVLIWVWEPGVCLRTREDGHLCSLSRDRKLFFLPFYVPFRPSESADAHLHWWGWLLLSLLIQMLASSGSTLIDTPRNNACPALWAQLSWHIKLTITQARCNFFVQPVLLLYCLRNEVGVLVLLLILMQWCLSEHLLGLCHWFQRV